MKIPCEKRVGNQVGKLYVHVSGNPYAFTMYQDFNSIKDLCEHFGVRRNQLAFWYSTGI